MSGELNSLRASWLWPAIAAVAIVGALGFSAHGITLRRQLFASLRIAKPATVAVNVPAFSGPNANRQLQDAIGAMLSGKVNITLDEPDQPAITVDAAAKLAGFTPQLPAARKDTPTLAVIGAHAVDMTVDRSQLRTIFIEAGRPAPSWPSSLDGATLMIKTPRAIRAQYGNCPVPVTNTLQNQIQGPPPPSTDNGNCIVLTQSPAAVVQTPTGLDINPLIEIALQLSGMSPNQTQLFQRTFDAPSTLVLSMPRAIRSYDTVEVRGAHGMLLNTGGRRGPTYSLLWANNGITYLLTGYGNPGDAVSIANSLH